jgi:hypothetical protein
MADFLNRRQADDSGISIGLTVVTPNTVVYFDLSKVG